MLQNLLPKTQYDIIIVGGGLVGLSMAQALAKLNLSIALLDHASMTNVLPQLDYDDRSVALSHGSHLIYKGMSIWNRIKDQAQAITTIHISDKGHFSSAQLNAHEQNVEALGYTIENKQLGHALYQAIKNTSIDIISPAHVEGIQYTNDHIVLTIKIKATKSTLKAQLAIAADGTYSSLRDYAHIKYTQKHYQTSAIIANISTQLPHQGRAYERFTTSGPIALLPLPNHRSSLVWSVPEAQANHYLTLSDDDFLSQLQSVFGYRLGKLHKVGQRNAFPLTLTQAQKNYAQRLVLIGNASHTLHPVAGQGLNLGMRDIAVLADLISQNIGSDLGNKILLKNYNKNRLSDHQQVIQYTHGLVSLFSSSHPLLSITRGIGLLSLDHSRFLKIKLGQFNMGFRKNNSRLERGLPLKS